METKTKYFNFPIVLLKNFLTDTDKCLTDILHYAVYDHSLKLQNGTQIGRIKASAKYFNVTLGSPERVLKLGEALHNSIDIKCPKAGINTSTYWDFKSNEKSEFDKVCLLGFLAIKSILQKKTHTKIDNRYWLARMDGKASSCEFSDLSVSIKKYANHYQTRKIKSALRDGWGLITYERHTNGFYVSFSMSLDVLVFEAEKRKKVNKEKRAKQILNEAYTKAILKLNGTQS